MIKNSQNSWILGNLQCRERVIWVSYFLKTRKNYKYCGNELYIDRYRGVRLPLFSWFPHFWKFPCAKISAFFFYFQPIFGIFTQFHAVFPHFWSVASHTSVDKKGKRVSFWQVLTFHTSFSSDFTVGYNILLASLLFSVCVRANETHFTI